MKEHMGGSVSLRAASVAVLVVFLIVVGFGLLGGCSKDVSPPFVTLAQPEIPAECVTPATREPRLKEGDVSTADAARDRTAMKWAFRNERNLRSACAVRLKAQRGEAKS